MRPEPKAARNRRVSLQSLKESCFLLHITQIRCSQAIFIRPNPLSPCNIFHLSKCELQIHLLTECSKPVTFSDAVRCSTCETTGDTPALSSRIQFCAISLFVDTYCYISYRRIVTSTDTFAQRSMCNCDFISRKACFFQYILLLLTKY